MAFTVSFGDSSGSQLANWGFILLIVAIFLFFTGLWRTISAKWASFFGSPLWPQTISNIKTTWATPQPAPPTTPGVNAVPSAPTI